MKNIVYIFITCIIMILLSNKIAGQTPMVKLTGTQFSFEKGNVNSDILLGIIAKKQEEVKKKLFQDLVIKAFNGTDITERSFTTYNYLYEIINTITTEKNKTIATREIMQSLIQFAVVYGCTQVFNENSRYKLFLTKFNDETLLNRKKLDIESSILDTRTKVGKKNTDPGDEDPDSENETNQILRPKSIPTFQILNDDKDEKYTSFNLVLDLVYDILINESKFQKKFSFKKIFEKSLQTPRFRVWYTNDNLFQYYTEIDTTYYSKSALLKLRTNIDNFLDSSINKMGTVRDIIKDFSDSSVDYSKLKVGQINALNTILQKVINRFQDQNTTRNLTLVAGITEFIKKYILTETDDGRNYLAVDIEAIILAIDENYNNPNKRPGSIPNWGYFSFFKPRFFLKMGATRGEFLHDNFLSKDAAGNAEKLTSIYYASEKIGFQFNFQNRGYTHSFKVGEPFYYHGKYTKWVRPQPQPTISKYHLELFSSGLLYNLANLKTSKEFNYMVLGANFGVTFFNGLSASAGVAKPVNVSQLGDNTFFNFSFDIPIVEYLTALVKK